MGGRLLKPLACQYLDMQPVPPLTEGPSSVPIECSSLQKGSLDVTMI